MPIATDGFGTIVSGLEVGGSTVIPSDAEIEGTYQGSLLCEGDVTVTGALTVWGNLQVEGTLYNSGSYPIEVKGNMVVFNGDFSQEGELAVQGDITVGGDFRYGDFNFPQYAGTAASMYVFGDMIGISFNPEDMEGSSEFIGSGATSTPGLTLVVLGDMSGTYMYLDGGDSGEFAAGAGGTVFVQGSVNLAEVLSVHGGDGTDADAGDGGRIEVHGSLQVGYGHVVFYGGSATNGNAGNGGSLSVDGNVVTNELEAYGGSCESTNENHRSGSGGEATIDGDLILNDYASFNGGSRYGVLTAGASLDAPSGGNLSVYGNCVVDGDLDLVGGSVETSDYAPHNAGNGGYLDCIGDMHIADDLRVRGGSSTVGDAGNGGYIDIGGDLIVDDSLHINGGESSNGNAGHAGEISVYGDLYCDYLNFEGGNAINGNGGNGGNVYANQLWVNDGVDFEGGNSDSIDESFVVGSGGSLNCGGLRAYDCSLYGSGGDRYGATTVSNTGANPGNAGYIHVKDNALFYSLELIGGDVLMDYPHSVGGTGGACTVLGSLVVDGTLNTSGGRSVGNNGGAGGPVYLWGSYNLDDLVSVGGAAENSVVGGDAGTNGVGGSMELLAGGSVQQIVITDGEGAGAAPVNSTTLTLGGMCHFGALTMTSRSDVWVVAHTSYPASVRVLSLPLKTTFNNISGAETVALNVLCEDCLFMSTTNSNWLSLQGTGIMD